MFLKHPTLKLQHIIVIILLASLWILVASLLFVRDLTLIQIIVALIPVILFLISIFLLKKMKQGRTHQKEMGRLLKQYKKANKRLKELDQMKSEFVSIASHQLRGPLTSIRGYASMLLEGSYGKLPSKAEEVVKNIVESSLYMATSVEDYLNVSRIEAGNMKYELSDFNLKNEAEFVADKKRKDALRRGLVLSFKSNLTKKGIVSADVVKTRQIINSLIDNSIKYTPKGTVVVFVYDDSKKKKIFVDIIDSGIGMDKGELDTIFDKFEKAHNANTTNVTGSGLGLYVARTLARHMKAEVTAFSDGVHKGSTFRLEMPMHM